MLYLTGRAYRRLLKMLRRLEYIHFYKEYSIVSKSSLRGKDIELYGSGEIIIGEGSYLGNRSCIQSEKGHTVKIGNNVSISHNVRIYTKSRTSESIISKEGSSGFVYGNVSIGDNCWIGANVFINPGVTIGQNVVVGANSVVTRSLESYKVYGGVPAKYLKG